MTASLSDQEPLRALSTQHKIFAMICVCLFAMSVIFGVIALAFEIKHLHETHIKHNDILDGLSQSRDWDDMQKIQDTMIKELQKENKNVGFSLIIHQSASFALGIIFALVYIGLALFAN